MRLLVALVVVALTFNLFVGAYPVAHVGGEEKSQHRDRPKLVPRGVPGAAVATAKSGYKAISALENKGTIAAIAVGSLVALVGAGLVGLRITDHQACMAVQRQQETMQKSWDLMHPDGFVPNGDAMRPLTFDCRVEERGLKPVKSYANAPEYY